MQESGLFPISLIKTPDLQFPTHPRFVFGNPFDMKIFLFATLLLCASLAAAKSDCEEHRERELKSNTKVKLVPKCDNNGDYEALQCFEGSPFCMCWRKDGTHVTEPSMKVKTCACHMHRDAELRKAHQGMVGNFVPSCEVSGHYSRKQCHPSTGYCWCSDKDGNRVSQQVRGEPNC